MRLCYLAPVTEFRTTEASPEADRKANSALIIRTTETHAVMVFDAPIEVLVLDVKSDRGLALAITRDGEQVVISSETGNRIGVLSVGEVSHYMGVKDAYEAGWSVARAQIVQAEDEDSMGS